MQGPFSEKSSSSETNQWYEPQGRALDPLASGLSARHTPEQSSEVFAPLIKTENGHIRPDVIFGLDSRLFETMQSAKEEEGHIEEDHQRNEVDLIEIAFEKRFSRTELEIGLKDFPEEHFYRIKGVLFVDEKPCVLNWAFGSFSLVPIRRKLHASKIVFMGTGLASFNASIASFFSIPEEGIVHTPAGHHHHARHEKS